MSKSKNNDVHAAFELLIEEIDKVIANLKKEITLVLSKSEYQKANAIISRASALEKFKEKVRQLQKEWLAEFSSLAGKSPTKRKTKEKLKKGLRTPIEKFRKPILESLVELGGSAPINEVLELVEKKMRGILNEYDYQILASSCKIRWRNTAQWCRLTLVKEGLLNPNSPRGIWEITEKGHEYLAKNNFP